MFQRALITGASSGIGRAIAEHLAADGTHVVLAARRRGELESIRAGIVDRGGQASICVLDVLDTEAVRKEVLHWDEELGGLDLVLANAGVGSNGAVKPDDFAVTERLIRINVLGALATLVAALGPMSARGAGTLGAVTSLAGMRGLPASADYSASKAAVSIYLEALRVELSRSPVRVVDIRPGFVDTPLTRRNRFKMPFLMDVEQAAELAIQGLERGDPVVSFPWQLARAMSVAEALPGAAWRAIAGRLPFGSGSAPR